MNILITGHRGFLGRHLKKGLREKFPHCNICICDTEIANLLEDKSLHIYNDTEFDYIFHLAAWTQAGDFCLYNQGDQWINNQKINTNILSYWKNHQSQAKLIAFGTSCAYPPDMVKTEKNYISELPDKDLFTYAMTKRMLLSGMQALAEQYDMRYIYFIPNTLYGPDFDEGDSHFIFDILKKIYAAKYEEAGPVVLWGSGNQCRELVYIEDAVKMIVDSIDKIDNEIINLGTGIEYRIKDYAQTICNYLDYNYEEVQFDTSAFEGVKSKKIEPNELLGACDFTSLENGLKEMTSYYINSKP
jgi:GDP-L-fucose synthase